MTVSVFTRLRELEQKAGDPNDQESFDFENAVFALVPLLLDVAELVASRRARFAAGEFSRSEEEKRLDELLAAFVAAAEKETG